MRRTILVLLTTMALALLMAGGVALAADITCSSDPCFGTPEDDHIDGTNNPEVIKALEGNDEIDGLDGADTLYGRRGDDTVGSGIIGGNDSDTSYGGRGDDWLSDTDYSRHNNCTGDEESCTGADTQHGGDGNDVLEGADEGDFIYGEADGDQMFGDPGNDLISGGGGSDRMEGEEGSDDLRGGRGNDFIDAADDETAGSVDTVDCGGGTDEVIANENDVVSSDCETITRVSTPTATISSSDSTDAEQAKAREAFLAENK
jgi:Ca2+-binding RTX toxin-like protein